MASGHPQAHLETCGDFFTRAIPNRPQENLGGPSRNNAATGIKEALGRVRPEAWPSSKVGVRQAPGHQPGTFPPRQGLGPTDFPGRSRSRCSFTCCSARKRIAASPTLHGLALTDAGALDPALPATPRTPRAARARARQRRRPPPCAAPESRPIQSSQGYPTLGFSLIGSSPIQDSPQSNPGQTSPV